MSHASSLYQACVIWLRVGLNGQRSAVIAFGIIVGEDGDRLTVALDEFGKVRVDRHRDEVLVLPVQD